MWEGMGFFDSPAPGFPVKPVKYLLVGLGRVCVFMGEDAHRGGA